MELFIQHIGRFGSTRSVTTLIKDLADDRKQRSATVMLSKMGAEAIPELVGALGDEQRRSYSGAVLTDIGESAIHALVEALDENKGGAYARAALARIQRPDLITPLLIEALADKARQAYACGMQNDYGLPTLRPCLPQLTDVLWDKDKQVYATIALVSMGPRPHRTS